MENAIKGPKTHLILVNLQGYLYMLKAILTYRLYPIMKRLPSDGNGLFKDDNDSIHIASVLTDLVG